MSIYRARLRNTSALSPRVSSEQIRLQVPPKLFGVDSWISQTIWQWIPNCRSGYRKSTCLKSAASNSWNQQLITSGRSQMLATGNFRDWHAIWHADNLRGHLSILRTWTAECAFIAAHYYVLQEYTGVTGRRESRCLVRFVHSVCVGVYEMYLIAVVCSLMNAQAYCLYAKTIHEQS